ncbi:MAG: hypothetical protein HON90_18035, partial [Halobacteriovoraceae bacterium]|nr:hypothetical protein [Halobacteriovoraceae bacterium]
MKTLLFLVIFSIGPVLAASASRDIIKISTAIVDDVADSGEREFIIPANSTNTVIVQFGIKFYHLDKTNTYRGPHCHNYNPPLEQKYRCKAWREYSDEISIDISK